VQCERRTEASTKATLCASSDPTLQKSGGRPERYPARGIKGEVSKQCDLRDDRRQKSQYCLAFRRQGGVKPRGASTKGPNRLLATHDAERPAIHT
jgi:hypothetical protein